MSSKIQQIVPNVRDIDVSINETISLQSINRNIEKLLQNDIALNAVCESVMGVLSIKEYIKGNKYDYGDLVWYGVTVRYKSGLKHKRLYLLRCIEEDNIKVPVIKIVTEANGDIRETIDDAALQNSGWKNQNQYISLIDMGLESVIRQKINFLLQYHTGSDFHKFGKLLQSDLSSQNYIGNKLLLNDMSNRNNSRSNYFFPYETQFLPTDDVVLNGFARRYDNGFLEYDIVFRLGYSGQQTIDGVNTTIINCNSVNMRNTSMLNDSDAAKNHNEDYFNSGEDYKIFNVESNADAEVGDTLQKNRGKYVNVYSADIFFIDSTKYQFNDNNYMVYCSDVLSQDRNLNINTINPGANSIVFCNKSTKMITALLIMTSETDNYNPSKSGIVSNSYHCKLIGRAKS